VQQRQTPRKGEEISVEHVVGGFMPPFCIPVQTAPSARQRASQVGNPCSGFVGDFHVAGVIEKQLRPPSFTGADFSGGGGV
jgi:hypothetical protein